MFDEVDFAQGDDTSGFGPNATVDDMARTPESEVADSLRALGDRIQEEYGSRLNSIVQDLLGSASSPSVNYNTLQNMTSQLLQQSQQGWTRVSGNCKGNDASVLGIWGQKWYLLQVLGEKNAVTSPSCGLVV